MAHITEELINEIQRQNDIIDVISRYVSLTKRGKNYFGLCPFHDDHNASMSVSPDKQIFKCFSCGKSGNVFSFVSEYNHISFYEAIILLGNDKGYNIKANVTQENKYTKEYEIYNYAVKIYQNNLNSALGQSAIQYLQQRQIDRETIKKFKIGLSLNKSMLTDYLLKKGYQLDKLIDLGITNENNKDKFLNRIMFPLFDLKGNPIAFSGRIYNSKDNSKYINTMETEIFKKGSILYNYHNAKDDLKKTDYVIVMEGFMDVIRASTIGINNCVATMGTAFTKEHILLLKKMTNKIILCFDGDKAGEEATISSLNLLEGSNLDVKIIRLPEDLDPDEYILKYGKNSFHLQIDKSMNSIDFRMNLLKKNKDLTNINDISKYIDEAIKELAKTSDEILTELTLKKLSDSYNIEYQTLKNKFNNYSNIKNVVKKEEVVFKKERLKQHQKAEYYLIYYMLNNNDLISLIESKIVYFTDNLIRYLYNEIIYYYHKYGVVSTSSFITYIASKEELIEMLNKIIAFVDKEEYTDEEINDYILVVNNYLKKEKIKNLNIELTNEIDPIKKAEILGKILEVKGVKIWSKKSRLSKKEKKK